MCDECGNVGKIKTCGGCRCAVYCSETCQKKAWPNHKAKCAEIATFPCDKVCDKWKTLNPASVKEYAALRMMMSKVADGGASPRCRICGDTNDETPLRRTRMGVLCTECVEIQKR